jgi:predicted nucleotidyltransferase component of viral defense system
MLSVDELNGYLAITGMQSVWQIERDYMQHIMLSAIYSKIADELVFKGGTMLQKTGVVDRFSIDLDFTGSIDDNALLELAKHVQRYFEGLGTKCEYKFEARGKLQNNVNIIFYIEGPYYLLNKTEKAKVVLRLQISRREEVLLKPESRLIVPSYSDLRPYPVFAMRLEEVAAEKVRAIMTRNEPRDIYDLYLLVQKGTIIHDYLVRKKLEAYAQFSLEKFEEQINKKEDAWDKELKNLLFKASAEHLVDFQLAKKAILESLSKNVSATVEFRKDDEGVSDQKVKRIQAHAITYLSLGNLAKINGVDIYPNKKIRIDLFFFEVEATDVAYISIHEHEDDQDLLRDFPVPIYPNRLSDHLDKITAKEGRDIHFKLSIEKEKADKLPGILHMALILSEA